MGSGEWGAGEESVGAGSGRARIGSSYTRGQLRLYQEQSFVPELHNARYQLSRLNHIGRFCERMRLQVLLRPECVNSAPLQRLRHSLSRLTSSVQCIPSACCAVGDQGLSCAHTYSTYVETSWCVGRGRRWRRLDTCGGCGGGRTGVRRSAALMQSTQSLLHGSRLARSGTCYLWHCQAHFVVS